MKFVLCVLLVSLAGSALASDFVYDPLSVFTPEEAALFTPEQLQNPLLYVGGGLGLIREQGFDVDVHFVTTNDGYILQVWNIPRGRNETRDSAKKDKPAILLNHGLLDSSDTWVLNEADQSFAFILADQGFNVWLSNSRGNKYSRNHTRLNPNSFLDPRFWYYTFQEMGEEDLPALVDYVRARSGQDKITYVGHSQGCTLALANFASPKSVADKLDLAILLAPAAHVFYTDSLLLRALAVLSVDRFFQLIGVREFLPESALLTLLLPEVCRATPFLCSNALFLIAGFEADNYDLDRLPMYVANYPAGTSTRDISHWAQNVREPVFRKYNYGDPVRNLLAYGSIIPPPFDLPNANVPNIAVFHGGKDTLASVRDVQRIVERLPQGSVIFNQLNAEYDHLAYTWGINAAKDIYWPAIELILQNISKG